MTVATETRTQTYNCNGALVDFAITFGFFETSDIVVTLITVADGTEAVLAEGADYSIATVYNNFRSGSTLTTVATYSNLYQIRVDRVVDYLQDVDLEKYDEFDSEAIEDVLDKQVYMVQQIRDQAVTIDPSVSVTQGSVIFYDGSDWIVLTPGVAGQLLQTNGASADPSWEDTGTGDMLKSIYDPTNVYADAFDMDNMVEGTANLILTVTERAAIISNSFYRGIGHLPLAGGEMDDGAIIQGADGGFGQDGKDLNLEGGLVGAAANNGGNVNIDGGQGTVADGDILLGVTSGKVGIKNANPSAELDVTGDIGLTGDILFDNSGDMVLNSSANDFVFKENANTLMTVKGDGTGMSVGTSSVSDYTGISANDIVTGNTTGAHGITIVGASSSLNVLAFAIGTSGAQQYGGFVRYYGDLGKMDLGSNGSARLILDGDGTLSVATASYETLVTSDDDIPNKKYVDDTAGVTTTVVGSLPVAGTAGRRSFVTDANATTFASIVAGGGANGVPVYDDGTNWRIG